MSFESGNEREVQPVIALPELKYFWRQLGKQLSDEQYVEFLNLQKEFVATTEAFVRKALATDNAEKMKALLLECHHWHVVTGSGPDAPEVGLPEELETVRRKVNEQVTAFVARLRTEFSLDF